LAYNQNVVSFFSSSSISSNVVAIVGGREDYICRWSDVIRQGAAVWWVWSPSSSAARSDCDAVQSSHSNPVSNNSAGVERTRRLCVLCYWDGSV